MRNLNSHMRASNANSVKFSLPTIWWLDTLKRKEEIIQESAFDKKKKKKKKRELKFNPGLALTGVQTTGAKKSPQKSQLKSSHPKNYSPNFPHQKILEWKISNTKNPTIIPITWNPENSLGSLPRSGSMGFITRSFPRKVRRKGTLDEALGTSEWGARTQAEMQTLDYSVPPLSGTKKRNYFIITHVRYIKILTWLPLRGFMFKTTPLSAVPRWDLSTKKTKLNVEKWPESMRKPRSHVQNFNISNVGYLKSSTVLCCWVTLTNHCQLQDGS